LRKDDHAPDHGGVRVAGHGFDRPRTGSTSLTCLPTGGEWGWSSRDTPLPQHDGLPKTSISVCPSESARPPNERRGSPSFSSCSGWLTWPGATHTRCPVASSSGSPWPAPVAIQPGVLLLDEPLSAVDAEGTRGAAHRDPSHAGPDGNHDDPGHARSVRGAVDQRPRGGHDRGAIEEVGTPGADLRRAAIGIHCQFIGAMNEIPVRIVSAAHGLVERGERRVTVAGADRAGRRPSWRCCSSGRNRSSPLGPTSGTLNGDLTMAGQSRGPDILGATTRLLVARCRHRRGDPTALPPTQRFAVDIPSANGRPLADRQAIYRSRSPVGVSRLIADRSAPGGVLSSSADLGR